MKNTDTRKRILFVLQLPPPVHGASLMNKHVVESRLLQESFETDVINLQFARNMKEIEKFSIRKVLRVFLFAWQIVEKLSRFRPDLIYFTLSPRGFAFYRDVFYVMLMKLFGAKTVFHLHGKGITKTAQKNVFSKWLCQWLLKKTDIICLSPILTKDVAHLHKSTQYVVPNGIEAMTETDPLENKTQNAVPQILYLSNYIRNKGVLVLVEALKIVHEQGLDFKARLVGAQGDLTIDELQERVDESGLREKVIVVGPRYREEKVTEFELADMFVFPTFYQNEAFPLVNLEAMQFGLPIISTDEGGIPDMLSESGAGFIVETQNPQMLAQKIATLLTDRDLREEMGKKGYKHFNSHYTLHHFEQNLERVFNNILGRQPSFQQTLEKVSDLD